MSDPSIPPVPAPQPVSPPPGYYQPTQQFAQQPAPQYGYAAPQPGQAGPAPDAASAIGGPPQLHYGQPSMTPMQYGQPQYGQAQYGQPQYASPDAWQQGQQVGYGLSATPTGGMSAARKSGLIAMLVGFGIMVVGIVITAVTYLSAAAGGSYVVAWGAIIFGAVRGVIGLVRFIRG